MILNFTNTDRALFDVVELLMEGTLVKYSVLGENAKKIHEDPDVDLEGPLEIGVMKTEMTDAAQSAFRTLIKMVFGDFEETEDGFSFIAHDVPVTIRIIKRKFSPLKNPNPTRFKVVFVPLPNPFNNYWKARNFVK